MCLLLPSVIWALCVITFISSPVNGAAAGHCVYRTRATLTRNKESVGFWWWRLVGTSYFILPLSTGWSSRLSVSVVPRLWRRHWIIKNIKNQLVLLKWQAIQYSSCFSLSWSFAIACQYSKNIWFHVICRNRYLDITPKTKIQFCTSKYWQGLCSLIIIKIKLSVRVLD